MDKYDRDPWHDAETIPLWIIVVIVAVVLLFICVSGCQTAPYTLEQVERMEADLIPIVLVEY